MNANPSDWLDAGVGSRPRLRWSFATDAPLACLQWAGETGELLAADASGGLYLLNARGRVEVLMRGFRDIRRLAWSDLGHDGVALVGKSTLRRFNRRLEVSWSLECPEEILNVATDPRGHYIAISLENGHNLVYDSEKRRVSQFTTPRPLRFLQFLATKTALLGAADHGLLCCRTLDGEPIWQERLWSSTGDLSATGDGEMILLAGFQHGIQSFDAHGQQRESFQLEGTPNRVSTSFLRGRIIATTVERQIYWMDTAGEMLWTASLPDDACRVLCDPLGQFAVCGLASGRLFCLHWR